MTDKLAPRTSDPSPPAEPLLKLALDCLSGILQFDYLSNGAGHRQSTALLNLRGDATKQARAGRPHGRAPPAPQDADEPAAPALAEHDTAAADAPPETAHAQTGPLNDELVSRYVAEIAKRRRLTSSEEYCLARAAHDGDAAARRQLIECHLGLVVMMARRYQDQTLPLLDRIEEGNLGLLTAIEKFDPELGHRFSTYAKWWIRQSIELAMMTQSRVVHVPVYVTRALKRSSKGKRAAAAADGTAGLAAAGTSPDASASAARDDELLRDVEKFLLFDASDQQDAAGQFTSGDPDSVLDSLPAPEDEQPDSRLQLVRQRERLLAALMQLNEVERVVVRSRYGLDDDETRTLQSIAAQVKLSPERVRQIQSEVLPKLRRILLEQDLDCDSLL